MHRTLAHMLAVGTLYMASAAPADNAPVNALWNDDNDFGVWIYGRPGSCTQFQYRNPPFVVVGNGGKRSEFQDGKLNATSLKVCMRATPPNVAFCTGGQLALRYEATNNEYVGSYRLELSDGTVWSGTLRAQHCKSK
jgi:hypothetical protein